jgi:hypothetical protein
MVATVVLQAAQVSARAPDRQSPIDGFWLGTLQIDLGPPKRMRITLRSDKAGRVSCLLDSLDDDTLNGTCANVIFTGTDSSFEVPDKGHGSGSQVRRLQLTSVRLSCAGLYHGVGSVRS